MRRDTFFQFSSGTMRRSGNFKEREIQVMSIMRFVLTLILLTVCGHPLVALADDQSEGQYGGVQIEVNGQYKLECLAAPANAAPIPVNQRTEPNDKETVEGFVLPQQPTTGEIRFLGQNAFGPHSKDAVQIAMMMKVDPTIPYDVAKRLLAKKRAGLGTLDWIPGGSIVDSMGGKTSVVHDKRMSFGADADHPLGNPLVKEPTYRFCDDETGKCLWQAVACLNYHTKPITPQEAAIQPPTAKTATAKPAAQSVQFTGKTTVMTRQEFNLRVKPVGGVFGYGVFGKEYNSFGGGAALAVLLPVVKDFAGTNGELWVGPLGTVNASQGAAVNGSWRDRQRSYGVGLRAELAARTKSGIGYNLTAEANVLFHNLDAGNPDGSVSFSQRSKLARLYLEGCATDPSKTFYGCLTGEGALAFEQEPHASWANAQPNNPSWATIKAVAGVNITEHFSARLTAGWARQFYGLHPDDYAQLMAGLCYQNKPFGNDSITIGCINGGASLGSRGNVALVSGSIYAGNILRHKISWETKNGVGNERPIPETVMKPAVAPVDGANQPQPPPGVFD